MTTPDRPNHLHPMNNPQSQHPPPQAGILLWSLFTFLTPAAAAQGLAPAIAARVLLGAGEGVAFPAVHSMIGEFVPPRCVTAADARRGNGGGALLDRLLFYFKDGGSHHI